MKERCQLRKIDHSLWVVDFETYSKQLHLRLRMTIIRLASGGLWLHSPVKIDDDLAQQIKQLGEVKYIVAPNLNHHFFVKATKERYPQAEVWGVQGFLKERPKIPVEKEFSDGKPFGEDLEAIQIQGIPFSREVAFYHAATQTLICTDLIHNIQEEEHFLTRQLWKLIGAWKLIGQNRYWKFQTKDRAASKQSLERIVAWGARRLIMSHGEILEDNATEHVRQSLGWLASK